MIEKREQPSRWFYGLAVLVILLGALISVWIMIASGPGRYPALIADAYAEEQHHISVPGSKDIKLTRTGAYGIYYEYSLDSVWKDSPHPPPAVDCTLTSKTRGAKVLAVPDHVETNRYWSKGQDRTGVLIKSITIDKPDSYTFACYYRDGSTEPEILVALGPNYVWEFIKVAGKISLSLVGAMTVCCGSMLMGLVMVVFVALKRPGL